MVGIIIGLVFVAVSLVVLLWRRHQHHQEQTPRMEPTVSAIDEGDFGEELVLESQATPTTQQQTPAPERPQNRSNLADTIITMRLIAEEERPYSGYELLQALLASGFRYGRMSIFHRYEASNGQGDVLFSLASATEPGTFDIQNMGACSCPGLAMFMQLGEQKDPVRAFELMLDTAKQLVNDLGGVIWDDKHRQLDQMSITRWQDKVRHFADSRYSYDLFSDNT